LTLLLLACGLLAVAMPGIRPKPMLVAAPRWFVRLAVASVGLGMFAIVAALLLSASVGALHLIVGGAVTPVDHLAPEGIVGSAAAAAAIVWIVGRSALLTCRAVRGHRAARVDAWLGEHETAGDLEVVIIPTDVAVAFNIPGRQPQIVISEGLRARLSADVLRFVLDHERAHLRGRDRWSALLATALETAFVFVPGAARTAAALRIGLERAADEDAAGVVLTRRRTIARGISAEGARTHIACGAELWQFRRRHLVDPPPPALPDLSLAALGLTALATVGVSIALHASADFSPYLALL
jgi:Zn-dependent protease with chaperone function